MKKAILYLHGKNGSCLEAEQYRGACAGFDVIGVDYKDGPVWTVQDSIRGAYDAARGEYAAVSLLANSIGAYFAMHTLQSCPLEKALFLSPVLDMERLILNMMGWAGVTEEELRERGEIPTEFGETLSWSYLRFVREHPIKWEVPTEILYGERDELISREMVDAFVRGHSAGLTVMRGGEHWFHTREQMRFVYEWIKRVL